MLLFVTVARQPAGSVTVAQDKTRGTIDLARDTVLEPERARLVIPLHMPFISVLGNERDC